MLCDNHGRRIEYLRLSVTDRGDLRCTYCMPEGFKGYEEPADWLTFDEIERVVRVFAHLGVRRIRLTGGEPLLRGNLAGRLSVIPGIADPSLSTNATHLVKHVRALNKAGISRLNVSLDTLNPARFAAITPMSQHFCGTCKSFAFECRWQALSLPWTERQGGCANLAAHGLQRR